MWISSRAPIAGLASLGAAEGSRACWEKLKGRSKKHLLDRGSAQREQLGLGQGPVVSRRLIQPGSEKCHTH